MDPRHSRDDATFCHTLAQALKNLTTSEYFATTLMRELVAVSPEDDKKCKLRAHEFALAFNDVVGPASSHRIANFEETREDCIRARQAFYRYSPELKRSLKQQCTLSSWFYSSADS